MISKTAATILAALLASAAIACDSQKTPSESKTQPSETSSENKGSEGENEKEKAKPEKTKVAPELEGPAPARDVLKEELEALEGQADTTLWEDEACTGFSDLEKCSRDEAKEEWKTAAECYRNFLVVGGPDSCRAAQFVKAAANFERAGKREAAVDARMQVVDITETPTAAAVDAADFMLEHGEHDRARTIYSAFRQAHPDSRLVEYIEAQCERVGGCAVSDAADDSDSAPQ